MPIYSLHTTILPCVVVYAKSSSAAAWLSSMDAAAKDMHRTIAA